MIIEDDGVPGVVTARVARSEIEGRGQVIDDFALSFVAPLGANDGNRFDSRLLCQRCHPASHTSRTVPFQFKRETLQGGGRDMHQFLILRCRQRERQARTAGSADRPNRALFRTSNGMFGAVNYRTSNRRALGLPEDLFRDVCRHRNSESFTLIGLNHQQNPKDYGNQVNETEQSPSR